MKLILTALLIGLFFFAGLNAQADELAKANRLFVAAAQLIKSSQDRKSDAKKLEQIETALEYLNQIIKRHPSSDLAVKLISGQSVGFINLEEVAEAAEKIRGKTTTAACYGAPITKCVLELALLDAKKIEWGFWRDLLLGEISATYAEVLGDFEKASAVVQLVEHAALRASYLRNTVSYQTKSGDFKAAFYTTKTIKTLYSRSRALSTIAEAQAKAGDTKAAQATFTSVIKLAKELSLNNPIKTRSTALSEVAAAQAKAGFIKGSQLTLILARSEAKTIEGPTAYISKTLAAKAKEEIDRASGLIAAAKAKAGNIKESFELAKIIENAEYRSSALISVAEVQATAEKIEAAKASLKLALSAAITIQDAEARGPLLNRIARALALVK